MHQADRYTARGEVMAMPSTPPLSCRRRIPLLYVLATVLVITLLDATDVSSAVDVSAATPASTDNAIFAMPALRAPRTITVDIAGGGDFTSVQAAINSVPFGNDEWIKIFIKRGIYSEKVLVPQGKSLIVMEGEGVGATMIEWGDYVAIDGAHPQPTGGGNPMPSTIYTASFTVQSDNFVARGITFVNTYSRMSSNPQTQAVAALVEADKVAFYSCSFIGFQDTLYDHSGRHYFQDCYIEGFVDFIFGSGQSIYEGCNIRVSRSPKPYGFITAHGRSDPRSASAFVFKGCTIDGDQGLAYLGRSWGSHPVVLFHRTYMSKVVHPLGWDPFYQGKPVELMNFAESECSGPGSDKSGRVKWEKEFTAEQVQRYTSISFVDPEGWLVRQPTE